MLLADEDRMSQQSFCFEEPQRRAADQKSYCSMGSRVLAAADLCAAEGDRKSVVCLIEQAYAYYDTMYKPSRPPRSLSFRGNARICNAIRDICSLWNI